MTPSDESDVQIARVRLSLGQVIVIVSFIVAMGVSWGVVQSTLDTNREIMVRIEARTGSMDSQIHLIREHQVKNEALIDGLMDDVEAIKERLHMPIRRPVGSALNGPKQP